MNANYKSIILAISLFFALSVSISAAPGDLDPTFGSGGIVISRGNSLNSLHFAIGMAIQADGKIVVVGDGTNGATWDFSVIRYNTDGSLDNSFGGTGIVITQVGNSHDTALSVAIQVDGKIVVVGSSSKATLGSSFAVVRYNPNGSLDTSFNGTGKVITSFSSSYDNANSVAIQTDGKIVVAGLSSGGLNNDLIIVRYNSNGSLDTTYNDTGTVNSPLGPNSGYRPSVSIQTDGKVVVAATRHNGLGYDFAILRRNTDGSPDTSFNGTGEGITSVGGATGSAIQTDGKIVVVGSDSSEGFRVAVVRYNPDGSLDTSFGGTGRIVLQIDVSAGSVAIQADGKIVITGNAGSDLGGAFVTVRLNPNGSLDTRFNGTGKVTTPFCCQPFVNAVAIQADGKIVIVGSIDDLAYDFYDPVVVRYQGDDATPTPTPTPSPSPDCPNMIDCSDFFVRQHYLDFLDREPEPSGLSAWLNVLNNCAVGDLICQHEQRLTTSAAFFGSPEFRLKGYFVFRFYRAAFARLPNYSEISADMRSVTGQTTEDVYARKGAFTSGFVERSEFVTLFNGLSNADYVAALLGSYNLTSISTPDPAQPDSDVKVTLTQSQLVSRLDAGTLTRAQLLRAIADSDQVLQAEFNRAFVAMQYYGYLRRTPEPTGYNSWLTYLNAHPQDFREMVRGFVDSIEYRNRFR